MPNTQRFTPGFFKRVLRFSVPAGVICAVSAFGCYVVLLKEGKQLDDARTGAAITLFIIAWFVLLLVARPLNALRLTIVVAMGLGFVGVLYIPFLSTFFALHLEIDGGGGTSVAFGIAGAVVLILIRKFIEVRVTTDSSPVVDHEGTAV